MPRSHARSGKIQTQENCTTSSTIAFLAISHNREKVPGCNPEKRSTLPGSAFSLPCGTFLFRRHASESAHMSASECHNISLYNLHYQGSRIPPTLFPVTSSRGSTARKNHGECGRQGPWKPYGCPSVLFSREPEKGSSPPFVTWRREIKSPKTEDTTVYHAIVLTFIRRPDCRMPMMWGARKRSQKCELSHLHQSHAACQ